MRTAGRKLSHLVHQPLFLSGETSTGTDGISRVKGLLHENLEPLQISQEAVILVSIPAPQTRPEMVLRGQAPWRRRALTFATRHANATAAERQQTACWVRENAQWQRESGTST